MTNTIREKLELTKEQGRELVWGDLEGYEDIEREISGHRRWSIDKYLVVKRLSDGKFFKGYYSVGATESQDEAPFEYNEPNFTEVFPIEKTVIIYE